MALTATFEPAEGTSGPDDIARRRNLGIYYTPPHAAAALAKWAIRDASDFILEPSFGGCALLGAAVDRLEELGSEKPSTQLQGFDIDPAAFIYLRSLFPNELSLDRFRLADFLKIEPTERSANVILANPPFVAYRQMTVEQRQVVREWRTAYSGGFSMESALWLYFLAHSLQFLKEGGRIAFVLPSSFIVSNYAEPVRNRIGRLFRHVRIVEVNERLFASVGAQERACLLLAEDYSPLGHSEPAIIFHIACEKLTEEYLWKDPTKLPKNQLSVHRASRNLLDSLQSENKVMPLGELLLPYIGEVTGDVSFFVKSKAEWDDLKIPASELTAVIHGSSTAQRAVVKYTDDTERLLLTPCSSNKCQAVAKYLASYPTEKLSKNITFAKRKPWWRIGCCTSAEAFVPSLHNAYFKMVVNHSEVGCTNSTYRLMPGAMGVNKFAVGLASLTSVAQLSAELLSRKLGGGALKLEPSDVRKICIPMSTLSLDGAIAEQHMYGIDDLIRTGKINEAQSQADDILLLNSGLLNEKQIVQIRSNLKAVRWMRLGQE